MWNFLLQKVEAHHHKGLSLDFIMNQFNPVYVYMKYFSNIFQYFLQATDVSHKVFSTKI